MTTNEQIAWLTEKLNQVVAELIQTQEELRMTRGELQSTQEALQTSREELQRTQEVLAAAQGQIAELEKVKTPPPAFVKAKKKKPKADPGRPHIKWRSSRCREYWQFSNCHRSSRRTNPSLLAAHFTLHASDSGLERAV